MNIGGSNLRCIFCSRYLVSGTAPRQAPCGDRLCGACLTSKGDVVTTCPTCGEQINLSECFKDRAAELEADNCTVKCSNKNCTWEGPCVNAQEHEDECSFTTVPCTNAGCSTLVQKSQLKKHFTQCAFQSISCSHCNLVLCRQDLEKHTDNECPEVRVECKNRCGFKGTRVKMLEHVNKECNLQEFNCAYVSCTYKGTKKQLEEHEKKYVVYHTRCMNEFIRSHSDTLRRPAAPASPPVEDIERRLVAQREVALGQLVTDMTSRLQVMQDNFSKLETVVQKLDDGFTEMSLSVQTLQATCYNGLFIWKIPEVLRRKREAVSGKTTSLYSAPFYTSRHGCKLCLRLYMNGDGAGKGTHLSFFITLMRGENDALLSWPFRQSVTLILLDQNKQKDIVQSFRPEATSSSFQRPRAEMNVASGCPMFAPLSLLDNSSYVKDDTMFLQCKVDLTGLETNY